MNFYNKDQHFNQKQTAMSSFEGMIAVSEELAAAGMDVLASSWLIAAHTMKPHFDRFDLYPSGSKVYGEKYTENNIIRGMDHGDFDWFIDRNLYAQLEEDDQLTLLYYFEQTHDYDEPLESFRKNNCNLIIVDHIEPVIKATKVLTSDLPDSRWEAKAVFRTLEGNHISLLRQQEEEKQQKK